MTESEWLASEDLLGMLECLEAALRGGRLSDRVRRLFAVACARRVWNHLVSDVSRTAVELSEHAADHPVPERDLWIANGNADDAVYELNDLPENDPRIWAAYTASYCAHAELDIDTMTDVGFDSGSIGGGDGAVAHRLRDLVGNPFRPVTIDPAWLTPTVATLAQSVYDERIMPSGELDPDRLAVLSDALEEAGCDNADILSHLRSPGPHVRGCWAPDLLLGKT